MSILIVGEKPSVSRAISAGIVKKSAVRKHPKSEIGRYQAA